MKMANKLGLYLDWRTSLLKGDVLTAAFSLTLLLKDLKDKSEMKYYQILMGCVSELMKLGLMELKVEDSGKNFNRDFRKKITSLAKRLKSISMKITAGGESKLEKEIGEEIKGTSKQLLSSTKELVYAG